MRRYGFIYNSRSGGGGRAGLLRASQARLRTQGFEVREYVSAGDPAAEAAAAIRDECDVIVACGGDGTVNAVARALVEASGETLPCLPVMGVLPLGTLNHFAKDLGIHGMGEAERILVAGHVREVDAGYVNGRLFVNNSGIGIYPAMVLERERVQEAGIPKWPAFVLACCRTLARMPFLRLRIETDGRHLAGATPVVFVGNNVYATEGKSFGSRKRMDEGVLGVCTARHKGAAGLIRLAFRALWGTVHEDRDFTAFTAETVTVQRKRHKSLQVSLDGEVRKMRTPLVYSIAPRALRVLAPEKTHE